MLAEIFMLRLEASARRAQDLQARVGFVAFNPAIRVEFRERSTNRRARNV
jgi:hypothetical protein